MAWLVVALITAWVVGVRTAGAIDTVQLAFERMEGETWHAEHVTVQLSWIAPTAATLSVSAAQITLPEPWGVLTAVELDCPHAEFGGDVVQCERGTLRARSPMLDRVAAQLSFHYGHRDQTTHFALLGVAFAGGTLAVSGAVTPPGWTLTIDANGVDAARLTTVLRSTIHLPEGLTASGAISGRAEVTGTEAKLRQVAVSGRLGRVGFMSADGLNAGENLDLELAVDANGAAGTDNWIVDTRLSMAGGTLCLETCWSMPERAVQFRARAAWEATRQQLRVDKLDFEQPGVTRGQARFQVSLADPPTLQTLTLQVEDSSLAELYAIWLQPLLLGTAADALNAEGTVAGNLVYRANGESMAHLRLQDVTLDDQAQRFGVQGLSGGVHWDSGHPPAESSLSWDAGHLYRFALGRSQLAFQAHGRSLVLQRRATVPVLDGALQIDRFRLDYMEQPSWEFDGILTPVSMAAVAEALGWPALSGTLSGVIPDVAYADSVLSVGGVLLVRAFDGDITVRGLQLERVLGVVPTLRADIDIVNLDLDTLTRTFSFGNIQGKLSGKIHQLLLQDWEPVAFDARFATPADDRSPHRISQKAVDNISSLGGVGVGGAVSRGVLRMFEDFSYSRLGIRCVLRNNVCEMGGVAPAAGGYYLVQGGGLPRIEVIGYADRVDWPVLVERLKRVTTGTTPTVQ